MGYVANKSRTILGKKYRPGDPVDVSDWSPHLIERMEKAARIVWVQPAGTGQRPAAKQAVPTDLASKIQEAQGDTAEPGAAEDEGGDDGDDDGSEQVLVYHRNGGYYYRVDNNDRVGPKGADAVRAAGYKIVEFAAEP